MFTLLFGAHTPGEHCPGCLSQGMKRPPAVFACVCCDCVTVGVGVVAFVLCAVHPPSTDGKEQDDCIAPGSLKALVGRGHPEFSTGRQQDALEYIQHLFSVIRRSEKNARDAGAASGDVTSLFDFKFEDKLKDEQANKYRVKSTGNNIWSLSIPLAAATNLPEVMAYEEQQAQKKLKAADVSCRGCSVSALVRRCGLDSCAERFSHLLTLVSTARVRRALRSPVMTRRLCATSFPSKACLRVLPHRSSSLTSARLSLALWVRIVSDPSASSPACALPNVFPGVGHWREGGCSPCVGSMLQ